MLMKNELYYISTDKSLINMEIVFNFLHNDSYWAQGRSRETVERSVTNSLCFTLLDSTDKQVGFARVITDYAVFAWLLDVFILDNYRGLGLGKKLITTIMEHPDLQQIKRWALGTKDAHGLYKKYGFKPLAHPENMMERRLY